MSDVFRPKPDEEINHLNTKEETKTVSVNPINLTSENSMDKLKEITDKLEQGIKDIFNSDKYKEYLKVMSRFHNYSWGNSLLIAMQKPDASYVAGYTAWQNKFKRTVLKGEKGIKIIAPSPYKVKLESYKLDPITNEKLLDKDGKPIVEVKEKSIPSFKVVSVFDVSQTEGKELPDITVDMLTGTVENFNDIYSSIESISPVPITLEPLKKDLYGYFSHIEKRIVVNDRLSELHTLKTMIHELAHAKLHGKEPDVPKDEKQDLPDKRTREVEAESVAYTVCNHFGLDTSDYSFGYIAGWSSNKELNELKKSVDRICTTSAEIINGIEDMYSEIQKQKNAEIVNENNLSVNERIERGEVVSIMDMIQEVADASKKPSIRKQLNSEKQKISQTQTQTKNKKQDLEV
ncbi:MAG: ImmA/IrrE family metallo-endopeptidase [Clostridia bacterium]|nr:ImmA/IrrE family metallo-endopeptidase [Clostridia bacterium]